MTLLIASVCVSFKCDGTEQNWLDRADTWREQGHEFFMALETGHGHDERFEPLRQRLSELGATVWTYHIDQGASQVDGDNRLIGICTGRNLAHELAQRRPDIDAILFIDSDIIPPLDGPERLLEVDHELVGGHVPAYCLDGPRVGMSYEPPEPWRTWVGPEVSRHDDRPFPEGADVREHWNTAGALLVRREAFRLLRWRWDKEAGLTDDPAFQHDAVDRGFGQTWVRHDSIWHHEPLAPLDLRGHDLSIIR